MFPSIFVRPEAGLIPGFGVFLVLMITFLIEKIRWVLVFVFLVGFGFYSYKASALVFNPNGPGSVNCLAIGCPGSQWPITPRYPIYPNYQMPNYYAYNPWIYPQIGVPWVLPGLGQGLNFNVWNSMGCQFCNYGGGGTGYYDINRAVSSDPPANAKPINK